jgi:hypothetical protein
MIAFYKFKGRKYSNISITNILSKSKDPLDLGACVDNIMRDLAEVE